MTDLEEINQVINALRSLIIDKKVEKNLSKELTNIEGFEDIGRNNWKDH